MWRGLVGVRRMVVWAGEVENNLFPKFCKDSVGEIMGLVEMGVVLEKCGPTVRSDHSSPSLRPFEITERARGVVKEGETSHFFIPNRANPEVDDCAITDPFQKNQRVWRRLVV